MLTPAQIRAARGMLDWSRNDLAAAASISVSTVMRAEGSKAEAVSDEILQAIRVGAEAAGISFLDDDGKGAGVRLRPAYEAAQGCEAT